MSIYAGRSSLLVHTWQRSSAGCRDRRLPPTTPACNGLTVTTVTAEKLTPRITHFPQIPPGTRRKTHFLPKGNQSLLLRKLCEVTGCRVTRDGVKGRTLAAAVSRVQPCRALGISTPASGSTITFSVPRILQPCAACLEPQTRQSRCPQAPQPQLSFGAGGAPVPAQGHLESRPTPS